MTDAVIVSTARTPIGKAYRGALNATEGATLLGHAIGEAVARAKVDPKEVEDVVMGAALQQGSTGGNIARKALLRAGLPVTVGGTTIDRQCASGLQAIALAARSVIFDGVEIAVGGGGESISLVQNDHANKFHTQDPALLEDQGRRLHADDRHRRGGGEALRHFARTPGRIFAGEPAPHRRRPAGRQVQRRAGADHDHDGRRRQGHRRNLLQGRDAVEGRRPASRNHGRRPRRPEARARRRFYHHRRQCQPALRRRQRLRDHERQGSLAGAA